MPVMTAGAGVGALLCAAAVRTGSPARMAIRQVWATRDITRGSSAYFRILDMRLTCGEKEGGRIGAEKKEARTETVRALIRAPSSTGRCRSLSRSAPRPD